MTPAQKFLLFPLPGRVLAVFLSVLLAMACFARQARADGTDIRPEPGGKRLLFVDGDSIRREPGSKRLLFIDGHEIRPEPNGKVLLYIDDESVRDSFGGKRLAEWDGSTLRTRPGGKILLVLDDDSIRPEMGGKRLYFVDGPKLTTEQLTAVLYQLKPDLFAPPASAAVVPDHEAAESHADAKQDAFAGKYTILGYGASDGKTLAGTVTVTPQGKYYALAFDTGAPLPWKGIGTTHQMADGTVELWAAVGPAAAVSLGVYQSADGKLTGTWIPVNAADDPSVLGNETLLGPANGGGKYKIEAGQLPNGGVKYTGAMNIDATRAEAGSDAKAYKFRWATGTTAAAFAVGDAYGVAAGWGADYEVIRVHPYLGNLVGNFVGKTNDGHFILSK